MRFVKTISGRQTLATGIVLAMASAIGIGQCRLDAAETPATTKSGSGTFVSFLDGRLTIKGKSGQLVYENVGENYKTYQNNEEGPGSKLVPTARALSGAEMEGRIIPLRRVLPGTMVRVDVEAKEIYYGFDFRVIGTFVSYQDGKLKLVAADAPTGFVKKPDGNISVTIDPSIPVLESKDGDYLKFAGAAQKVLKTIKPGELITTRSHYDPDVIEAIEIGTPKHRMERYIGEARGPVRGTLVSFKDGILRIRGRALGSEADKDYERLIARRISADIPIYESIDGREYRPATIEAFSTLKEGAIITIRKVEDVILEIQIGVPKK